MLIRECISSDCEQIAELFYQTVHTVNAKDYAQEQLCVWATGHIDLSAWNKPLLEHNTRVAVKNDIIVGFGDIDKTGYLDRLYVHKDYQRQGVATALCNEVERGFDKTAVIIYTYGALCCIQCGLIQINTGYKALFEAGLYLHIYKKVLKPVLRYRVHLK